MDRRTMFGTVGAAFVHGVFAQGCGTSAGRRCEVAGDRSARARPERPLDAAARPSVFENFHRSLLHVHGELRTTLSGILISVASDGSPDTNRLVGRFCQELLNHHHAEDAFFFPSFRAAGRLRSSDVAFLDARDAEHRDVHRLCLELRDVSIRHARGSVDDRAWRTTIARAATELSAISDPHFSVEESTLTASHVATVITGAELAAVYRDMGENWNRR